jgi:Uma2 family endonuclease
MSTITNPKLPTHLDLPFKDESVSSNFLELPASILLTDSVMPYLEKRHPNAFVIGQDSFIYYHLPGTQEMDCRAPDWFCVLGVPPLLDGRLRNSYVMWQEHVVPSIVLEFVSDGDSTPEHDATPRTGKFWVYEQAIRAPYYGIFDPEAESLEVYALYAGTYQLLKPNEHGRHFIGPLGLELGLWRGHYYTDANPWLRWWNAHSGALLLIGHEEAAVNDQQARVERQRAEAAQQRAEASEQRAAVNERRLEEERHRAEEEQQRAEAERQRAEAERQRAEAERQRAEQERQEKEKLKDKLRSLGIDPDTI